jgi:hypothetical protein
MSLGHTHLPPATGGFSKFIGGIFLKITHHLFSICLAATHEEKSKGDLQ